MSFDDEWARCSAWLQAALDEAPETHSLDDVKRMVLRKEAFFWAYPRSCCVGTVWTEPKAKIFNHWLAGGDLDDVIGHQPHLERWARAHGCTRSMMGGRRGFEKLLKPHGFQFAGVVLTKEL